MKRWIIAILVPVLWIASAGPARAITAEVYEKLVLSEKTLRQVYLRGITATAEIAAKKGRVYCLPPGTGLTPDYTQSIIDGGLAALRKRGRYDPRIQVEAMFLDVLARKFPCAEVK